ncbi:MULTISPECIES: APC family permease [unclassified Streptomyces]|uniref:APC family permease n=1 Tax=unclassified Streptomyces TaxID=2593676 RepID=UPI00202E5E9E|nr:MULTISPECIES: APC family permease [unclassified Streptomyces]MCM1972971.1 APC family permease [Streptomyces sp. G1]MCX5129371.1 APC family permease [Streptomyces sp. NBC_00347]
MPLALSETRSPATTMRRTLGVRDGMAIAASSTAATTSIGIGMGALAVYAGRQTPALLIVAFLPILGIALSYARLNRTEPNCGNGYTWVGRSLGAWPGFLTGWVVLVANVVFMAYTSAVTGSVILQFANKAGIHRLLGVDLDPGSTGISTVVGLVALVTVTVTAVTGVRSATRLQWWLLAFEYIVLLVFCTWALIVGDEPFSLNWLNPFAIDSLHSLAQGLVLAVFVYWGWDAAFTVNEETKNASDASRGGLIALLAMLGLFVFASVSLQRVMGNEELMAQGPQALTFLGAKLSPEPWASLPLAALMCSAFASLQSSVIPTARGALAMGRDQTLGKMWTKVHPRFGSPAVGTVVIMALSAAVATLAVGIPKINMMILTAVNSIGLIVTLYYGLTALACAVRFRSALRAGAGEALRAVVVPVLSALALLGLGGYLAYQYAAMSDHFEARPDNGWFMLTIPSLFIATGLVAAAFAKWSRRSPYFATGRGTDADAIVLPVNRAG